eukprot:scaffold270_cov166-Amphora_coffeaeformis.AAC.3
MSEDETEAILKTVEDCAERTQCGVEDVSALLDELKTQEKEMTARLESMGKLIEQLKQINSKGDARKADEVRAFVQDLLRVFEHGGKGFPVGFSGDIGDGPMTAYDALPPKKWKKPTN